MWDRTDPTLLINILGTDMTTKPDSETTECRTAADVRRALRRAKTCAAQVTISGDASIEVEVSKAAILRAIAGMPPGDPCGGVLFVTDGHFRLDGYGLT